MSLCLERNRQDGSEQNEHLCFRSKPNCSLSGRQCKWFFWGIAGVTFSIAAVFGAMGYWLVLPFAGLEIGVLAWAFDSLSRHRNDFELLEIAGDEIFLESRQGERMSKACVNRCWAQLVMQKDAVSGHVRLALRSHGQDNEIGLFLNDEDRMLLCNSLKAWLKKST